MQILVATRLHSSHMAGRSGGLFDVSLTDMLGFEQVPCLAESADSVQGIQRQKFENFIASYSIQDWSNAVSMVYEQHSNNASSLSSDDSSLASQSDSEDLSSDSEDDLTSSSFNSNNGSALMQANLASATAEEMETVAHWYGVFVPSENALYLESPSASLHNDSLTDILDIADCVNCFKVYIGIPRNRLDIVRQYLFAGFEISKKGKTEKSTPAGVQSAQANRNTSGAQNHILLEYEL